MRGACVPGGCREAGRQSGQRWLNGKPGAGIVAGSTGLLDRDRRAGRRNRKSRSREAGCRRVAARSRPIASRRMRPRSGKIAAMPGRPDFRLYHSNALDVLAELLAARAARARARPAAAGAGHRADPAGRDAPLAAVDAGADATASPPTCDFLTPGEFVASRARRQRARRRATTSTPTRCTGSCTRELAEPAALRAPAFAPLRAYLPGDDPLKPWSLAGELAGIFEKYQAWRRDWLLAWEAGTRAGRSRRPTLWRRVAAGRRHRARRIDDYLARFGATDGAAAGRAAVAAVRLRHARTSRPTCCG